MQKLGQMLKYAVSDGVPRCSLNVAIVVGTLLNLINQGDVLFGIAAVSWPKLLLTYLVPYGVSTHGAVASRMRRERQEARTRIGGAAEARSDRPDGPQ
jgi:hypothetical protein